MTARSAGALRTVFTVVALLTTGCSVSVTVPGEVTLTDDTAGWTRSANYTTCDQWLNEMTQPQRIAMVSPILEGLRQIVDTAATPGDELLPAYIDAISATCRSPEVEEYEDYGVTAAAALAFDERFQP